ncbi:DUF5658 family protein [Dethiobacter alkaliphilus]|uniref:DUF5658 domain-containing protein n=1 Tax=Dethiobacter alkaliphilus AHT 1 TaxID=555088 RepID=C0GEE8_DETAL|nr:DUF5658 family protein [Dethiobacter alkaliphilus]EEG78442.1 conserved hypothetical protein [Dethiobacter alkaliphilus AHT 1]
MGGLTKAGGRDRLLWLLLLGVGVFNVADYFLTLYALSRGMREGNPVMDMIVDTVYFPKVKLVLVPLLLLLLWLNRQRVGKRLYVYVWIIFIAYFLLMVYYAWLFWEVFS